MIGRDKNIHPASTVALDYIIQLQIYKLHGTRHMVKDYNQRGFPLLPYHSLVLKHH